MTITLYGTWKVYCYKVPIWLIRSRLINLHVPGFRTDPVEESSTAPLDHSMQYNVSTP